MKVIELVVRGADDLTPEEIIEWIRSLRNSDACSSIGGRIFFEVEAGRKSQLESAFPYPDLLDQVKATIRLEDTVVYSSIRSWQDPEHEEQQAAWCLAVQW